MSDSDTYFLVGFAVGIIATIVILLVIIPAVSFAIENQPKDPACMGWGTTNGKEFSPPSTEWYNEYCHNLTFPITSDVQGHITESCACYESKHNMPIQWKSPLWGSP